MAITLNGTVDAATRARFDSLEQVNPARAQELANSYNSGGLNPSAFDREVTSSLASYGRITSSSSGLNASAARFGRVIPLRSEVVPQGAGRALETTESMSSLNDERALAMRPDIIAGITEAIS
mgnify:CR=1 FL=1